MVGIEYNVKIVDVKPLVEGRWASWSRDMRFCFLEAGFVHYLDGMNAPDEGDLKKVQTEWHIINSWIIGTLAKHVSPALKQELEEDMLAADAWRMLKSRTHQEGIFAKLNLMHKALRTKFSFNTPTLDTLAEIKNLSTSIYKGG